MKKTKQKKLKKPIPERLQMAFEMVAREIENGTTHAIKATYLDEEERELITNYYPEVIERRFNGDIVFNFGQIKLNKYPRAYIKYLVGEVTRYKKSLNKLYSSILSTLEEV